jgi:hypothetical protein
MPKEKEEKKAKADFVVKDRRIFADGNLDAKEKEKQEAPSVQEKKQTAAKEPDKKAATEKQEPPLHFPAMNFSTFVASLNASALLHLGIIEDPSSGTKNKSLPMAKQTIDILSIPNKNTTGNLSEEEENLLKNILYDLRIMYVKEKG